MRSALIIPARMNVVAVVRDLRGRVLDVVRAHNLITDAGLAWWRYNMFNDISGGTDQGVIEKILLGTGTTAPARSDTTLENEINDAFGVAKAAAGTRLLVNVYLPPDAEVNGQTITEVGLETSTTTGSQPSVQLFNRAVLPTSISKTSTNTVRLLIRIALGWEDKDGDALVTFEGRKWGVQRLIDPTGTEHAQRFLVATDALDPRYEKTFTNFADEAFQSISQSGPQATISGEFGLSEANLGTFVRGAVVDNTDKKALFMFRNFTAEKDATRYLTYDAVVRLADANLWRAAAQDVPGAAAAAAYSTIIS